MCLLRLFIAHTRLLVGDRHCDLGDLIIAVLTRQCEYDANPTAARAAGVHGKIPAGEKYGFFPRARKGGTVERTVMIKRPWDKTRQEIRFDVVAHGISLPTVVLSTRSMVSLLHYEPLGIRRSLME